MAPEKAVPGEDGNREVMKDSLTVQLQRDSVEHDGEPVAPNVESANIDADMIAVDASSEDGEHVLRIAKKECRDAISQMLDSVEPSTPVQLTSQNPTHKIESVVHYNGRAIYESTLVSELNGNLFLSKDRLTRIKNSVYFNNAEDYLSATNSTTTAFLGLGTDYGCYLCNRPL